MLGPSWVALFRQIPAHLHDVLVMSTATGAEIVLQKILVMEADYFVFRGRMSGSQDGGLVIILPYDQICNVAFNKRMLEPEVLEIFGNSSGFVAAAAVAPTPNGVAANGDGPTEPAKMETTAAAAASTSMEAKAEPAAAEPGPVKPGQVSKNTLLTRLRARLAGQSKSS
jgi:hypothetical protein